MQLDPCQQNLPEKPIQIMDVDFERVGEFTLKHFVGLIGINQARYQEILDLFNNKSITEDEFFEALKEILSLGSGVLIRAKNTFAILTADHVKEYFNLDNGYVDLGLVLSDNEDNYKIPIAELSKSFIRVGRKFELWADSPDLAFIILSSERVKDILGYGKEFYDLDNKRSLISDPLETQTSKYLTIPCGILAEFMKIENPYDSNLFTHVINLRVISGISGPPTNVRISEGFDYFDVCIRIDSSEETLNSMQGISGGAVWRLPIVTTEDNFLIIENSVKLDLIGICIRERETSQGLDAPTKLVAEICHGWESIYTKAYQKIME